MKKLASLTAAAVIFAALIIYPAEASSAASKGLDTCARLIIPTLFPFFVATVLLSESGFADRIGSFIAPFASKLFGISGKGATAFIVGLTGGYPLGAAYISDMRRSGLISSDEASVLIVFCSNSGPAFIIGAVGVGVFSSSSVGIFLYAVHILAAAIGGIIFGGSGFASDDKLTESRPARGFAPALTDAVKRSVASILNVCGFVVAFTVFTELLCAFGPLESGAAKLSGAFGCELLWGKALFTGIFELGSGVGAMCGLALAPENLALAAFLLGWGGISVHFQTFALLEDTGIKTARYMIGRFIIALIAALLAYIGAYVFF